MRSSLKLFGNFVVSISPLTRVTNAIFQAMRACALLVVFAIAFVAADVPADEIASLPYALLLSFVMSTMHMLGAVCSGWSGPLPTR